MLGMILKRARNNTSAIQGEASSIDPHDELVDKLETEAANNDTMEQKCEKTEPEVILRRKRVKEGKTSRFEDENKRLSLIERVDEYQRTLPQADISDVDRKPLPRCYGVDENFSEGTTPKSVSDTLSEVSDGPSIFQKACNFFKTINNNSFKTVSPPFSVSENEGMEHDITIDEFATEIDRTITTDEIAEDIIGLMTEDDIKAGLRNAITTDDMDTVNATLRMRKKWQRILSRIPSGLPGRSVSSERLFSEVSQAFVMIERSSPAIYALFSNWLKTCSPEWMATFLERGGLDLVLKSIRDVDNKTNRETDEFAGGILQLMMIQCVKAILNTEIGMKYIIHDSPDSAHDFSLALDSSNITVKDQVFKMLTGICLYSSIGYELAIKSLEHYKSETNQKYRFTVIMKELRSAKLLSYKTSILAFVNAIVISTVEYGARRDIRNEFVGVGLLDAIDVLRDEEDDEGLSVQLEVFVEHKNNDDAMVITSDGLDLNDHHQVTTILYSKACFTRFARIL